MDSSNAAAAPKLRPPAPRVQPFGPIDLNAIYTLELFRQLTGLAGCAMREACKGPEGLRVVKVGRRKFVRGSDFAAFLERVAEREEHS